MKHQTLTKSAYTKIGKREKILCSMLLIPFISHWLLPDGLERTMYLDLGIPFYAPNICYFIYLIGYGKIRRKMTNGLYSAKIKNCCLLFSVALGLYGFVGCLLSGSDNTWALFFNNQSIVWTSLLFLQYPLNFEMIDTTKYVIIPTAVIISLEVLLFSLGLLQYREELGNIQYQGVMRISTTVGEATGTAVVLAMMGSLICIVYKTNRLVRHLLLLLITISIFFTMSRGSVAMWVLFMGIVFWKENFIKYKLSGKIKSVIIVLLLIYLFHAIGVFAPLYNRIELEKTEKKSDNERIEMAENILNVFSESNGMGVGCGQTNIDKSLTGIIKPSHYIGVHNYYLFYMVEMGIIGILLLGTFFIYLIRNFDYSRCLPFFAILLLSVSFNTEPIFVFAEFMAPVFFIIMASIKRKSVVSSIRSQR